MIRRVSILAVTAMCAVFASSAQSIPDTPVDDDELLRLPGQGEVRDLAIRERTNTNRLKPGAGLFITFDANGDGRISRDEVDAGIPMAFSNADRNEDGHLTALEQQDWAQGLPTRDDSLANPFRFDPNLDRRVDLEEFTSVIVNLGLDYADEESGDIIVADLKAPRPERVDRDSAQPGNIQRGRIERQSSPSNRSIRH